MGGGTVFRSVARLVGAATVGAAAVPSAGAFCHANPTASTSMREQESFSAMLNHSQKGACDFNINRNEFGPSVDVRFEHEEHECSLANKEEGGPTVRQLVFSPPTEEEVEEATKELHAALHLSIPTQGSASEEEQPETMIGIGSREVNMNITPKASDKRVMASLYSPFNDLGALAAESSSVMQAFQLLQTNPKVQDVVKSLACDPAVWNAVLSNEKVLELTQEDSEESQLDNDSDFLESEDSNEATVTSKLYGLVMTRSKVYCSSVKRKVLSILNSMFGSMETTIFKKEGRSTKDKTVASCMMLAVAVVIVVVVRRSLRRHQT